MTGRRPLLVGSSGDIGAGFRKIWGDLALYAGRSGGRDQRTLDLAAPASWPADLLDRVSYCLIAAGISKPDDCFKDREATHAVNVTGTGLLLDKCKAAGVVPVFFSSEQVYGLHKGPADEVTPAEPATVYGCQKLEIERKIVAQFQQFIILRISRVEYGSLLRSSLIGDCARKLLQGQRVFAYDQTISLLYIDDLVEVTERLMRKGASGIFNVRGLETMSRSTLAGLVQTKLQAIVPAAVSGPITLAKHASFPTLEPRADSLVLKCDKVQNLLGGFMPRSVSAILQAYCFQAALREGGL
jgi:dTDP-4-dehydrorhamnose reductase